MNNDAEELRKMRILNLYQDVLNDWYDCEKLIIYERTTHESEALQKLEREYWAKLEEMGRLVGLEVVETGDKV